jgi:phosphoglycolate phosphatase-like HAD superfamily hydrolase
MYICLFDIDGTLLSSGGAGKAAMELALASAFGAPPSSDGVPFSGRTDRAIARDLFALSGIPDTPDHWHRFVVDYLHHLPGCLARSQGKVLPGIAALLETLSSRGDVVLGLLTGNIRDGARLKLAHYGIFHHFAFGAFGDQHLERDQVAHDAVVEVREYVKRAVPPEDMWVIGDTPLDVRCARAIGARAVAVATGWHKLEALAAAEPDLLLADFSDPAALFTKWGTPVVGHGGCNTETVGEGEDHQPSGDRIMSVPTPKPSPEPEPGLPPVGEPEQPAPGPGAPRPEPKGPPEAPPLPRPGQPIP